MIEKLKAGTYYVGDPCYVLRKENGFDWGEVLDETNHFGHGDYFEYRGHGLFTSRLGGDGEYKDQEGRLYSVDTSSIACIPVAMLGEKPELAAGHAHVHEFTEDFECFDGGDFIYIGHLRICTGQDESDWY